MEDGRQPLAIGTLVAAWTLSGASAGWWTAFVVASFIVPAALPVAAGVVPRRSGISMRGHLRAVRSDVVVAAAHVVLGITFVSGTLILTEEPLPEMPAELQQLIEEAH